MAVIARSISSYVNSQASLERLQEILDLNVESSFLTSAESDSVITNATSQLQWTIVNQSAIRIWFNPTIAPTEAPTTAPTTGAPEITTIEAVTPTTQGSSSIIASFAIVVACAVVKMFV